MVGCTKIFDIITRVTLEPEDEQDGFLTFLFFLMLLIQDEAKANASFIQATSPRAHRKVKDCIIS